MQVRVKVSQCLVQGVYVADVGKVMGVLEPVTPITLPFTPQDPLHMPDYRLVACLLTWLLRW